MDMRLKILRKERPAFEIEGAVINGNRMDLSNNELKPPKHRSNTSFALPASLNNETSPLITPSIDQTNEMSPRSRQQIVIPTPIQPSNLPSYQAIETAYLEQGIRIRLSPTKTGQQSARKSANSLQQHTAFINRNPSRTSSVLHYTTTNLDQNHDSRSFSALQQTSSNDFEPPHTTHNVSYAQSSQINEETCHNDYLSPSIIASEHSNILTPSEKLPIVNEITSTTTPLFGNDPDLVYMSKLLQKSSGDAFRDTIRRRAGLRATFAIHRHPLTASFTQPQPPPTPSQPQSREKSPNIHRNSLTRMATIAVSPGPPVNKIDRDILKHASRIRKLNQTKDYLIKSPRLDSTPIAISPPRIHNNKRNSINKPLKSISLEPLEFLLSSAPRSASLSVHDVPTTKTSSKSRNLKTPTKRTKSPKVPIIENPNITNFPSKERSSSSSILHDESLSLMKTSPLDMARQSNSFDSGCYDHSCSSGDIQSLTSSSIIQMRSSIPSGRLTNSAARRSHSNKKVSFYDEPKAVIVTAATYV